MARVSENIFYNIEESFLYVESAGVTYFFSSEVYRDKFIDRLMKNRQERYGLLTSRHQVPFHIETYFDLMLYNDIEKRGFKVIDAEGNVIRCLSQVRLDGKIRMKQSLDD